MLFKYVNGILSIASSVYQQPAPVSLISIFAFQLRLSDAMAWHSHVDQTFITSNRMFCCGKKIPDEARDRRTEKI